MAELINHLSKICDICRVSCGNRDAAPTDWRVVLGIGVTLYLFGSASAPPPPQCSAEYPQCCEGSGINM